MTDKELLELAARAGGVKHPRWLESSFYGATLSTCEKVDSDGERLNEVPWNPLTDDGDALRLAVKLKIIRVFRGTFVVIENGTSVTGESLGYDSLTATRRAIVRAAAEIGKAMYAKPATEEK